MADAEADIAWQATIAAALARRGKALQLAGLAIGLAAAALSLVVPSVPAVVIGLAQIGLVAIGLVLGARTALDADLFGALARTRDAAGFDRAMLDLRLLPPGKAGRPMPARIAGLMRLLRWQAAGVALQLALLGLLVLMGNLR